MSQPHAFGSSLPSILPGIRRLLAAIDPPDGSAPPIRISDDPSYALALPAAPLAHHFRRHEGKTDEIHSAMESADHAIAKARRLFDAMAHVERRGWPDSTGNTEIRDLLAACLRDEVIPAVDGFERAGFPGTAREDMA